MTQFEIFLTQQAEDDLCDLERNPGLQNTRKCS